MMFSHSEWSETRCFIMTPFEHSILKIQKNHVGMKLNGTHQLLSGSANDNL
jgi:hypothetical protein